MPGGLHGSEARIHDDAHTDVPHKALHAADIEGVPRRQVPWSDALTVPLAPLQILSLRKFH